MQNVNLQFRNHPYVFGFIIYLRFDVIARAISFHLDIVNTPPPAFKQCGAPLAAVSGLAGTTIRSRGRLTLRMSTAADVLYKNKHSYFVYFYSHIQVKNQHVQQTIGLCKTILGQKKNQTDIFVMQLKRNLIQCLAHSYM